MIIVYKNPVQNKFSSFKEKKSRRLCEAQSWEKNGKAFLVWHQNLARRTKRRANCLCATKACVAQRQFARLISFLTHMPHDLNSYTWYTTSCSNHTEKSLFRPTFGAPKMGGTHYKYTPSLFQKLHHLNHSTNPETILLSATKRSSPYPPSLPSDCKLLSCHPHHPSLSLKVTYSLRFFRLSTNDSNMFDEVPTFFSKKSGSDMDEYETQFFVLLNIWIIMAQVFTMNAQLLRYRQQQRRQRERSSLEQRTFVRLHLRREEINRITRLSDTNCLWELRMDRNAFAVLCDLLQTHGGLVDDGHVTIEEQVATFVNILAQHNKNRSMQVRFVRSSETISRYIHRVLCAFLSLQDVLFAKPTPIPEDCCLGALDGTYIGITVPNVDRPRYRTRKGHIATNVLGVCTHDLKFVYVLFSWEGSTTDSRVLSDAVTRANGLKVPTGTYYLVDSGYTNGEGFLAPYRGTRYHLQEWEDNSLAPRNHEEYFNMKHSSARNVIERCFGLLKRRWAILLHNFIRMYMAVDPEENARLAFDELPIREDLREVLAYIKAVESSQTWTQWRDDLAREIYDEWRGKRA
ncbi:hypothetical protein D8674_013544 [Pyrus ussuriensis x Pyrus communis]|uniref:Uncharacterized protein n=1 Tax=Pyrus ussuriensis x Pyrus communis TaxID=2448454 RepID=A0A5N5GQ15_9ROSA|nr:hypothetical protein D8674_013544 [Pyrus ussuriensis x Pyrus communis]